MQLPALLRAGGLLVRLRVGTGGDVAAAAVRGAAAASGSSSSFATQAAASNAPAGQSPEDADLDLSKLRAPQGWWADPAVSTAQQAFDVFDAALDRHRHLRQRHVQEIIRRCQSGDDISLAVKAMHKLRRFRAAEEVHAPFNHHTCKMFVQQACLVGAPGVAAEAFSRYAEIGLHPTKLQVDLLLKHLGKAGELDTMVKLLECARRAGLAPTPKMAYSIVRAAAVAGQPERGAQLAREMELNGVRMRSAGRKFMEPRQQTGAEAAAPAPAPGEPPVGASATSSAAAASTEAGPAEDAAEGADADAAGDGASPTDARRDDSAAGASAPAAAGLPPGVAS